MKGIRSVWAAPMLLLALSGIARAELVFDPNHPAFKYAHLLPLDERSGFTDRMQSHQLTQYGVQFDFTSASPKGFANCSPVTGTCFFWTWSPEGARIQR